MACMDLDKLDRIGIQPLKDMLKEFGGWPVLEDNWDESNFKWYVIKKNKMGWLSGYQLVITRALLLISGFVLHEKF